MLKVVNHTNIDFEKNKVSKPKCWLTLTTDPPVLLSEVSNPIPKYFTSKHQSKKKKKIAKDSIVNFNKQSLSLLKKWPMSSY